MCGCAVSRLWASVVDAFLALGLPKCLSGSSFLPGFSGIVMAVLVGCRICMGGFFYSPHCWVYLGNAYMLPWLAWEGLWFCT